MRTFLESRQRSTDLLGTRPWHLFQTWTPDGSPIWDMLIGGFRQGELSGLIGGFWVEPGGVKRFLRAGGPQWFSEDDRSGLTRGSTEPFVNYTEAAYWSSETNDADTAWAIDNRGKPLLQTKASGKRVWPVRNR